MSKYSFFAQVTNIETSRDVLKLIVIRYHKRQTFKYEKKKLTIHSADNFYFEKQQRPVVTSTTNLGYASTASAGI